MRRSARVYIWAIVAAAAFNDLKSASKLLDHIMFADDTNSFYSNERMKFL